MRSTRIAFLCTAPNSNLQSFAPLIFAILDSLVLRDEQILGQESGKRGQNLGQKLGKGRQKFGQHLGHRQFYNKETRFAENMSEMLSEISPSFAQIMSEIVFEILQRFAENLFITAASSGGGKRF